MTELVMEDSSSLDAGPNLFIGAFDYVKTWGENDEDDPSHPRMSFDEAKKAAATRLERFKDIHEEVRRYVIEGLKADGILLGQQQITQTTATSLYVSRSRIAELRQIRSADFDLRRLIRLCEELNKCFGANSFFATAALVRTIINHVPPLFGATTFAEVANNIGGKSHKKSLLRLQTASRDISDAVLHQQIQKREVLPTAIQVDFKNELDILLSEIVRLLG